MYVLLVKVLLLGQIVSTDQIRLGSAEECDALANAIAFMLADDGVEFEFGCERLTISEKFDGLETWFHGQELQ